ncbi:MAG: hypothetical protein L0Y73_03275, partial [Candidatus Aminicenantes bacterium]|nr:hypothetical protein [Candidatus Aminicenantes bacterium]
MKKTLIVVLAFFIIVIIVCFSPLLQGKSTHRYYVEKPVPGTAGVLSEEAGREKHEQFARLKKQMEKWSDLCSSTFIRTAGDTPSAGEFTLEEQTVSWRKDAANIAYVTGLCKNVSEPQATLIFLSFEFFDNADVSLGKGLGMAFGPSNIQVPTEDGILCLGAMHPGEKGLFVAESLDKITKEIDYVKVAFNYGVPINGLLPLANAKLSIESVTKQTWGNNSLLQAHATVKNSSPNYAAVTTFVALGVYDINHVQVIDAAATYAGGTSSPGYNWAVYPMETETADFYYTFGT